MLPATIATSVAPETIAKVGRLFNGSATDVLNELLQNARRAGAARVRLTTTGTPGDRLLTIADDGDGIADPAVIVTLGRSSWSADTLRREDPAGMGVFSLAGRDVIVRSWSQPERRGWMAHIPAGAWQSSRPIAIEPDPIARGTAITVRIPDDWAAKLRSDAERVALFYPLPVEFDGDELPRQGWLDAAVRVEEWNGSRIGIFRDYPDRATAADPRLNFHGVTIPCSLPKLSEVGRGHTWTAKVDIIDMPEIQLVLPARKEAVQNAALEALRNAIRGALFRTIVAEPSHRLSFDNWTEAAGLGVDLPEAAPYLFGWVAPHADRHSNYETGIRITDAAMVVMPDIEPIVAQPAALALKASGLLGPLVGEEAAFAGYAKYDALARTRSIDFSIEHDGQRFSIADNASPEGLPDGYVDAITMTVTLDQGGRTLEMTCNAEAAFAGEPWPSDPIDEVAIFVRRGAGITPAELAHLFEAATFDPSDDCEADSPDTQRDRFQDAARARIVGLLEGSDAALETQVRAMLSDHAWIVPDDRTVTVTLTRRGLTVAIADRQPEAA